ncbi:hypothetical protein N9L48_02470 [Psychrosphaera sp.]|nr:hypothetical protein [Psychrosphaera sp.]
MFTESTITFDHTFVKSEEVYLLDIESKIKLKKAWIEPLNMQMGHIPIILEEKAHNRYSATLLIGLCAEPIMQWMVYLEYENGVIDQQTFASYWSEKYRDSER